MEDKLKHGIIIREIRKRRGMKNSDFAREIGRSRGWLSDVERCNGKCTVGDAEFDRILKQFKAEGLRPQFRTWIANAAKFDHVDRSLEGAVLKYVRLKKGLRLKELAKTLGCSSGYLSKVENGRFPPTVELRKKVLMACGYSPESFKNLYKDKQKSKAVPARFKLEILLNKLTDQQTEAIYEFALRLAEGGEQ